MLYETFANTMMRLKSRFSNQVSEQTQALPVHQRHHLAHRIETELLYYDDDDTNNAPLFDNDNKNNNKNTHDLVQELEYAIQETSQAIRDMEESEGLLYRKINTFRKLLDSYKERKQVRVHAHDVVSVSSSSTSGTDTDAIVYAHASNTNELEKVKAYEAELSKIEHVHREILIGLEQSRRKLTSLQDGKEVYVERSQECMEFLIASAELDRSHGDDVDEELKELEICALNNPGRRDGSNNSLTATRSANQGSLMSENVV